VIGAAFSTGGAFMIIRSPFLLPLETEAELALQHFPKVVQG
jgi:hypothetical protein